MNQRDAIDRFNSDVDHLLRQAGLNDPGPTSDNHDELLNLAQKLATTDLSKQSRIRYSLRRRLLSRIENSPVTSAEVPGPWSLIQSLLRPKQLIRNKLVLASLIVALSLVIGFSLPGLQLRQRLVTLLAQLWLYLPIEQEVSPHVLVLRWQFRGEGGIGTNPIAANGMIYVGSNGGYLYALDGGTGQEIWRFEAGENINFSPAVAGDLVYAVSGTALYALDSYTGQEQWRFTAESPFSTAPALSEGMVYAGGDDGQFYALRARTGEEIWRIQAGNAILNSAKGTGRILYVTSQDRFIYALESETGYEKWRFKAGDWMSAAPLEVGGEVYVGSHDENLYVLDTETGQEKRRYEIRDDIRSSAVLGDGVIYFGSYNSLLYAVDAETGQEKWRFKMGKQTRSAPIVVEGIVYIGSGDGYLYGINAQTGEAVEQYGVDSQIYSTPAVAGNILYFVSGKGDLYAVQRIPQPSAEEEAAIQEPVPAQTEPPSFQFTPGGWYIIGELESIWFKGRIVDGAGNPVNGFSIQADNGPVRILSAPSGPNRWQPDAAPGEWQIAIAGIEQRPDWWWLTVVRADCETADDAPWFDTDCQQITRLSESIKIQITYPTEMVFNADWTCHWDCQNSDEK